MNDVQQKVTVPYIPGIPRLDCAFIYGMRCGWSVQRFNKDLWPNATLLVPCSEVQAAGRCRHRSNFPEGVP